MVDLTPLCEPPAPNVAFIQYLNDTWLFEYHYFDAENEPVPLTGMTPLATIHGLPGGSVDLTTLNGGAEIVDSARGVFRFIYDPPDFAEPAPTSARLQVRLRDADNRVSTLIVDTFEIAAP